MIHRSNPSTGGKRAGAPAPGRDDPGFSQGAWTAPGSNPRRGIGVVQAPLKVAKNRVHESRPPQGTRCLLASRDRKARAGGSTGRRGQAPVNDLGEFRAFAVERRAFPAGPLPYCIGVDQAGGGPPAFRPADFTGSVPVGGRVRAGSRPPRKPDRGRGDGGPGGGRPCRQPGSRSGRPRCWGSPALDGVGASPPPAGRPPWRSSPAAS